MSQQQRRWFLAVLALALLAFSSWWGGGALVRSPRVPYRIASVADTTHRPKVQKTHPQTAEDIARKHPMDLRNPSQLKSEFIYDGATG